MPITRFSWSSHILCMLMSFLHAHSELGIPFVVNFHGTFGYRELGWLGSGDEIIQMKEKNMGRQ